jgi:DNA-damage-inducible protein J
MNVNTQTINIRINKNTKLQAQKIVEKMGLDLSSAVKLFLNKVILTKSIPFTIRTVNGYTPDFEAKILKEAKHTEKYGKRYSTTEEAFREFLE